MTYGWVVRVLGALLLVQFSVHAVRPMISYQALDLGASAATLGVVAASYGAIAVVLAIPAGRWADRVGSVPSIAAGTLAILVSLLLLPGAGSLLALGVSNAVLGAGQLVSLLGIQTLVANGGSASTRNHRFGALTVVASVAQILGPAIAGLVAERGGVSAVYLVGVAVTVLAGLIVVTLVRWPAPVQESASRQELMSERSFASVARILRTPSVPQAMLASLAVLTSIDVLIAYLPAYGEANGIPVSTITLLLAIRAGGSLLSRLTMIPLIRLAGRRLLLSISILVSGAALAIVPLTTAVLPLALIMALAGFGLGLGQPLSLVWVASRTPIEVRGTAIGLRLTGNRVGQLGVPMLAGAVAGVAGIAAVFIALSGLLVGTGVSTWRASFE